MVVRVKVLCCCALFYVYYLFLYVYVYIYILYFPAYPCYNSCTTGFKDEDVNARIRLLNILILLCCVVDVISTQFIWYLSSISNLE